MSQSGPSLVPTDPLLADQWHLTLIGDISAIWTDYSGLGVQVGVYDDGIDFTHPDLDANYDSSLHVENGQGQIVNPFPVNYIPAPFPDSDLHGTAVAGIIAAEANGVGGTGVSYGATITGVNIFGTSVYGNVNGTTAEFIDVVLQGVVFDISQNSWGSTPRQSASASLAGTGFAAQLEAAYAVLASEGRGGLGTVITQAAGNDGLDANRDGINASRYTITVAATDELGRVQSYSNFGASILVAAPAAAVTTDLAGAAGSSPTDYMDDFGGTSAATPVVSGVVALMLEANPDLGWRDVQNILAASASLTGSQLGGPATGFEDGAWFVNGAETWNGGGMHVHTSYGYGMVDAYAAVRMAEVWSLFEPVAATSANELTVSSGLVILGGPGGFAVPDTPAQSMLFTLEISEAISIEQVALTLDIDSDRIGDLKVVLISPEGTEVVVALNTAQVRTSVDGLWTYGIESLRGELSAGIWTVQITDMRSGSLSSVSSATLDIYGSAVDVDDVHHITDEFAAMVAFDASRAVLTDTDGGTDWLNFAAVAGATTIDLNPGGTFAVDGTPLGVLSWDSAFENVVTGDGNDFVTGNDAANALYGMRGDDALVGDGGGDQLFGDIGNDSLWGGAGIDLLDGGREGDLMVGGEGYDTYRVDDPYDVIVEEVGYWAGGGVDRVESSVSHILAAKVEVLVLQGSGDLFASGRVMAGDLLIGNSGSNQIDGRGGNDRLNGDAGDDILIGGAGRDMMLGAAGADVFVFGSAADTGLTWQKRDVILDFETGVDRIDLSGIDANLRIAGDQAFSFIGAAAFSGDGIASAGEIRGFSLFGAGMTLLGVDLDGNGDADMQIMVSGTSVMSASDFYL